MLLALLLPLSAIAQTTEATTDVTPPTVEHPQTQKTGRFLPLLLSSVTTGASAAGAFGTGAALNRVCFSQESGRPSPVCSAGAFAVAGAVQLALNLLIIPELYRLSGDDTGEVRLNMWRWMRWPALILAAAAATFLVGAVNEEKQFDTGQEAMMVGAGGVVVGGIALDVFAIVGAFRGAVR